MGRPGTCEHPVENSFLPVLRSQTSVGSRSPFAHLSALPRLPARFRRTAFSTSAPAPAGTDSTSGGTLNNNLGTAIFGVPLNRARRYACIRTMLEAEMPARGKPDDNHAEIVRLRTRVNKALESFSINDLRQLVREIEEIADSDGRAVMAATSSRRIIPSPH
jgi:hypothetical protein